MQFDEVDTYFARGEAAKIDQWLKDGKQPKTPIDEAKKINAKIKTFLSDQDFLGAETLLLDSKHRFDNSPQNSVIREIETYFEAIIHFIFARYDEFEKKYAQLKLKNRNVESALTTVDLLYINKLLAEKHFHFNENKSLNILATFNSKIESNSELALYLKNAVNILNFTARGEFLKALHLSNLNSKTADLNGYTGLFAPLACKFIKSICFFSLTKKEEALNLLQECADQALKLKRLDWFLVSDGQLTRQLGAENKTIEALAKIKDQRDKIENITESNGFSFFADANELYIRTLMKDEKRVEILISRLPEISLVKQAKANHSEWAGGDIIKWIENLPEDNPRERIYKFFAYAEYHQNSESIAIQYMKSALELVEETGAIEFLLRQHNLTHIILKAFPAKPNAFQENLVKKLAERVSFHNSNVMTGLPIPLSKREIEILTLLATGKKIREIGEKLNISMNTMKTHVKSIYRKLDVDSRDGAIQKAEQLLLL